MRHLVIGIAAGAAIALAVAWALALYQPQAHVQLHNPYWPFSVETAIRDR